MSKELTQEDFIQERYKVYKKRSAELNREFDLSFAVFKELLINNCYYCGLSSDKGINSKYQNRHFALHGIDRINSDLGYTPENVVTSCFFCNQSKSELSQEAWLNWIHRVSARFPKEADFMVVKDNYLQQIKRYLTKRSLSKKFRKTFTN